MVGPAAVVSGPAFTASKVVLLILIEQIVTSPMTLELRETQWCWSTTQHNFMEFATRGIDGFKRGGGAR